MLSGTGAEILPYWSFTKTALAICALKLVEAGRLELDAPLKDAPYSLRQLLEHSAGLPDYGTLPAYHAAVAADEEPWSRAHLREATLAQGMRFAPGTGWCYSNLGYMQVGELIEEASGQPLATHLREALTAPLGLSSVRLATRREDFAPIPWPGARSYHPGWVYHGCLTGTAPDAARLLDALFRGTLLAPPTLARMLERQPLGGAIEGRPWTDCGYALGLMSARVGGSGRAIGHSGGGPFCVNAVYHFPDLGSGVTVASFAPGPDVGIPEAAAVAHAVD
ncbi:serine hydrolase [Salipiger sp. H15]|uniref:Serine hydrolase n=1 Tax=Alloyangia sp. H15 TaxID=3029062 RepID=A0AAU8AEU5_9RHOB